MSINNSNEFPPAPNHQGGTISMEWLMEQHNQQQQINAQLIQGLSAIQATLQTPSISSEPATTVPEARGTIPVGNSLLLLIDIPMIPMSSIDLEDPSTQTRVGYLPA